MKLYRSGAWMILAVLVLLASLAYSRSPDHDQNRPQTIARQGKQPRVAIAPNGDVGIVYGLGPSIYFCLSKDGGGTYTQPVEVAKVDGLMLGMRRGPQIAMTKDYITVSAIARQAGNLLTWTSKDGGARWSGPINVNDVDRSAREGLHALSSGKDNQVIAAWLDLRDDKMKLFGACSTDGGKTWTKNLKIYESPDGTICECCHPSLANNHKGTVYVMWRNWLNGARDMYIAASTDAGATYGPAQKLGRGTWPLKQCPMDGGGLATDAAGNVTTLWRRESTVFKATATPGQEEQPLGSGKHGVVALADKDPYMVWQDKNAILLLAPRQAQPSAIGQGAYPTVASAADGKGPVIIAWEATDTPEGGVVALRVKKP